jgi:hypothetical protein
LIKSFFLLINLHPIAHNDKAKHRFVDFLTNFSQKYSDHLLRTFLAVFFGMMLQAWHTFEEFLPFFSADTLKLCQIGWGVSLHSYFWVSRDVRSVSSPGSGWATQRHSETCPEAIPALSWL